MRLRMQRTNDTKNEEIALCVSAKEKIIGFGSPSGEKQVCGGGDMLNKASYLNNLYHSAVEGIDD